MVPVPIEYGESVPEMMVADIARGSVQEVPIDVVGNLKKRKRGRKPRCQNPEMDSGGEDGCTKAGDDGVDGPYGPELRRRTEGLGTQAELIGFLDKVSGKWGSARKKRKTVDASEFGESLPKGWKLLLRLTRRANRVWPICSGYISPNGHRFTSYKEVSSYLCSMRLEDAGNPNSDKLIPLDHKVTKTNAEEHTLNNDNDGACHDCCLTSPSVATSCESQLILLKSNSPQNVPLGYVMNGGKCALGFEKDIQHESQISHKLCLQGSHFEGLVEVNVNIDKTIEPAPEVTSIEERVETTALGEASPEVSNMQALVGINRDPVPQSFDAKAENKSASIFFHEQLDSDIARETCIDKFSHQDEEQTKSKNNGNCSVEEIYEKQDRDHVGSYSTNEKGSEATDIGFAKPNFYLGAKDVPIYNRNKSHDQDSLKCTHEVNETCDDQRIFKSYTAGEEAKTGTRSCTSIGSPVNQYEGDVIGQLKDTQSSLKIHEPKIDHGEKLGDKEEEVKQQVSPERCSGVQNEQESFVDCMNGNLSSTVAESSQEVGSKGGLSISTSDEQACVADDCVNAISRWTLDFQKPKVVNSQTTVDFSSTCGRPDDDDAVTNIDLQIISESSLVSSCNEDASVEKVSTFITMFPQREKGGDSCSFAPFDSVENHANKISVGTMEDPKLGEEEKSSSELFVDFGGFYGRHDASAVTSAEEETRIGFFSVAPSGGPGFSLGIGVNGISYGPFVDPIQNPSESELMNDVKSNLNQVAASSLGKKTLHETNRCWNSELTMSLGSNQTGLDINDATNVEKNKTSENCFLVHSAAEHIFGDRSSGNGVPCSTLEEPGQERSIERNTYSLSCSKLASDAEINLEKANTVLTKEELELGKFEHPESNRIVTGLGRNIAQSDLWRTFEETSLQDGLALPKFPLLQSSNCFPAFDLLSNKVSADNSSKQALVD